MSSFRSRASDSSLPERLFVEVPGDDFRALLGEAEGEEASYPACSSRDDRCLSLYRFHGESVAAIIPAVKSTILPLSHVLVARRVT